MKYRYLKNIIEKEAKGFDDRFSLPKQKKNKFNEKDD